MDDGSSASAFTAHFPRQSEATMVEAMEEITALRQQLQNKEEQLDAASMENEMLTARLQDEPTHSETNPKTTKTNPKTTKTDPKTTKTNPKTTKTNPKTTETDQDFYLDEDDEEEDDFYLTDDDDLTSAAWAAQNPVAAVECFISISSLPSLQKYHKKFLTSVGTLMVLLRENFPTEFASLSAALVSGTGLVDAAMNLALRMQDFLGVDAKFLTAVCLSNAVFESRASSAEMGPFASKVADCVSRTWRAYKKTKPTKQAMSDLRAHFQANTVPESLAAADVGVPSSSEWSLDPERNPRGYARAHTSVLVLLKHALTQVALQHNTPATLRAQWHASFPALCDDVDFINSAQAASYAALIARVGLHSVKDEERVSLLRACFSPPMRAAFTEKLADRKLGPHNTPWEVCLDIARAVEGKNTAQGEWDAVDAHFTTPASSPRQVRSPSAGQAKSPSAPSPLAGTAALVYPRKDDAWVQQHKSDLIAYGVCSNQVLRGSCSREPCLFSHELPEVVDTTSANWQSAVARSQAHHERRRLAHSASATVGSAVAGVTVPEVAAPSPPIVAPSPPVAAPSPASAPALDMPPPNHTSTAIVHTYATLVDWWDHCDELPPAPNEDPIILDQLPEAKAARAAAGIHEDDYLEQLLAERCRSHGHDDELD